MGRKALREGEIVFREGESGDTMYRIVEGQVEIARAKGDEKKVLGLLGAGSMFGEHGLLRGLPRTATAKTTRDTVLEMYDKETLLEKMAREPEFALRFLSHLSDVTRRIADEYMSKAAELGEDAEAARERLAEIEFEGPA